MFFLLLPGNSWSYQPLCPQFVRVGHKQSEWWFYFTALHLSRNPQWSLEHHWQLGDQLFSPPVSYSRIQGSLLLWKIKKKIEFDDPVTLEFWTSLLTFECLTSVELLDFTESGRTIKRRLGLMKVCFALRTPWNKSPEWSTAWQNPSRFWRWGGRLIFY